MLNHCDTGNPSGEPAVFIHGFMSSNHQWDLNVPRLGTMLRTILVELPGHGGSPAPDDPAAYRPEAIVDAIEAVREHLEIDKWWVVGNSMGGAAGVRYALTHPERTSGVAFTNSRAAFGIDETDQSRTEQWPPLPTSMDDLRRLPYHPMHAKRFPSDLQKRMMAAADAIAPHAIAHLAANAVKWRALEDLPNLTVPTLLVNGQWESAFQAHVATAGELIPDIRIVELEGGHSINIEQPEGFDRAVLDFIQERGVTQ